MTKSFQILWYLIIQIQLHLSWMILQVIIIEPFSFALLQ